MVTSPIKIEKYPTEKELMGRVYDAYVQRSEDEAVNDGYKKEDFDFNSEDPKSIGAIARMNFEKDWSRSFKSLWNEISVGLSPKQKEQLAEGINKLIKKTNFYYDPTLDNLGKNKQMFDKGIRNWLEEMIKKNKNEKEKTPVRNLV